MDQRGIIIDENSLLKQQIQQTKKCKSAMKRRRPEVDEIIPSAFKQTNKRKYNKKTSNEITWNHVDIITLHEEKLKELNTKRENQLILLYEHLDHADNEERLKILEEINHLESREDELEYLMKVSPIINEYLLLIGSEQDDTTTKKKHDLISKYFVETKQLPIVNVKVKDMSSCSACGGKTIVCEGFITCVTCGVVLERSMKFEPGYKDMNSISIKHQFSYKRLNRFNEILSTVQGKENSDVPLAVIDAIRKEIQKNRSLSISSLTVSQVRLYLKRIGQNHYYEHSTRILSHLTGVQPEKLPSNIEDTLRQMFKDIQKPFEEARKRVCPQRSSFLNYNYILYKFCEKLGLYSFAQRFSLLKSVEKLRIQDMIWKDICEQLDWKFIPTC